jgi:NitT/TauT family transport system permease protein
MLYIRIIKYIYNIYKNYDIEREFVVLKKVKLIFPLFAIFIALAVQIFIPDSDKQPTSPLPYFTYVLAAVGAVYILLLFVSLRSEKLHEKLLHKAAFNTGAILALCLLNLFSSKLALLPVLYFPTLDRVFGVFPTQWELLAKCLGYSCRLLFFGFFGGAIVGFITGVAVGFSKHVSYWLMPVVRLIGPIPSTAWIPIVLVLFPTAVSASAFLIALAVWFPVTLMTSSGIANITQSYFDAGATLGCGKFSRIVKIGIPSAMPHIFLGVWNGACASFITLVTAELVGARYGIGWYINWQKEMLSYANVYAGLIIIAVSFFILVTLLFKVRDRLLGWQKGVIKW